METGPVKVCADPLDVGLEPPGMISMDCACATACVISERAAIKEKLLMLLPFSFSAVGGACVENRFHDRDCREGVGPAGVEGDMSDDLSGLCVREAVIHGPVEMVRDLGDLARGNQRTDRDQAAISGRKARTKPEVTEEDIRRVLHEPRRRGAGLFLDTRSALFLRLLVEGEE